MASDRAVREKEVDSSFENLIAIIPAYEEEATVGGVVSSVKTYVDRVLVIDDAS